MFLQSLSVLFLNILFLGWSKCFCNPCLLSLSLLFLGSSNPSVYFPVAYYFVGLSNMFLQSLSLLPLSLLFLCWSKCSCNPSVYYPLAWYSLVDPNVPTINKCIIPSPIIPGFIQMFLKSSSWLSLNLLFQALSKCSWNPWVYYPIAYYTWLYPSVPQIPGFIQCSSNPWVYANVPQIPEFIIP